MADGIPATSACAMTESPPLVALICAAGRSSRFFPDAPASGSKVFVELEGRSVLERSVRTVSAHSSVRAVVIMTQHEDCERALALLRNAFDASLHSRIHVIPGGETRQRSVYAGLCFARERLGLADAELVLVHDAARCLLTDALLSAVVAEATRSGAATLAIPIVDTVVRASNAEEGLRIKELMPRDELWAIQTPQVFQAKLLCAVHERAAAQGQILATDDAGLVQQQYPVALVRGHAENMKITLSVDVHVAQQILGARAGSQSRGGDGD